MDFQDTLGRAEFPTTTPQQPINLYLDIFFGHDLFASSLPNGVHVTATMSCKVTSPNHQLLASAGTRTAILSVPLI